MKANDNPALVQNLREKLAGKQGPEYWRSLQELANTGEFQKAFDDEFPSRSAEWLLPANRREILRLMAASLALAGITGCTRQPAEQIVPYVRQPENLVPGLPLFFATSMPLGGFGYGLLAESHMARPTKVEGNPDHPASLGATTAIAQASVLDLYDPDRSQVVINRGEISSWVKFLAAMGMAREQQFLTKGAGFRILTETVTSPSLASQIQALLVEFPDARWHQFEPVNRDASGGVTAVYDLSKADVILSLDSNFLAEGPGCVRYARQFADSRRLTAGKRAMNRLYVAEPFLSCTGMIADHRIRMKAGQVEDFARQIAVLCGALPGGGSNDKTKIAAIARDLTSKPGRSLVIPGEYQPAALHALARAINEKLGNVGSTVVYSAPLEAHWVHQMDSLRQLTGEMNAGKVELLLIASANPVYHAPADLNFRQAMDHVPLRAHLGLYRDETAEACHWHMNEAHYLESWNDVRAFDGTASIIQPLIDPLYGGKTPQEFLSAMTTNPDQRSRDLIRAHWQKEGGAKAQDFDAQWNKWLHDGLIPNSAPAKTTAPPNAIPAAKPSSEGLEIVFRPDPSIWDGRFANNAWLQELSKPATKLTWDNAVHLSPETAKRLGVENEDVVTLGLNGAQVDGPVWIAPGQADETVVVHLGFGRTKIGRVGNGVGFNVNPLRTTLAPWSAPGVTVKKKGARYRLACTQEHHSMEGRGIVREATLTEFVQKPDFAREASDNPNPGLSMYPNYEYTGYAWGMAIDQGACIGCNACVTACQAENNISTVGKEQVLNSREMHWIRIDRYFAGPAEDPETLLQPMLCQHCELAPCEPVCPVAATVHSGEGLNQMVYNRCVGTRYCSNNCPYKVRRFNFHLYADWQTPSLFGLRNPDVTVRSRGVMEKCTFCIQRISKAKIAAEKEDRQVKDGEIQTACEQACPTRAIVFGNVNDLSGEVTRLHREPLAYKVLGDLQTRPRISYLARVRNENPEMKA